MMESRETNDIAELYPFIHEGPNECPNCARGLELQFDGLDDTSASAAPVYVRKICSACQQNHIKHQLIIDFTETPLPVKYKRYLVNSIQRKPDVRPDLFRVIVHLAAVMAELYAFASKSDEKKNRIFELLETELPNCPTLFLELLRSIVASTKDDLFWAKIHDIVVHELKHREVDSSTQTVDADKPIGVSNHA